MYMSLYVRFAAVVPLLFGLSVYCVCGCSWDSEEVRVGIVQIVFRVARHTQAPFVAVT